MERGEVKRRAKETETETERRSLHLEFGCERETDAGASSAGEVTFKGLAV